MALVRKWGPWVVLLAVAVAALVIGLQRSAARPTLDGRVEHISSEVRCPVCHGETVAQSQAAPSVEIRNLIRSDLQKGESENQILASIVASYGPGILEKPQAKGVGLLVWVLPVVGVGLAATGLLVAFRRWRSAGERGEGEVSESEVAGESVAAGSVGAGAGVVLAEDGPVEATAGAGGGAGAGAGDGDQAPTEDAASPGGRSPRSKRMRLSMAIAGAALVAAGVSWAVVASSATRLPGQGITGQALGAEAEAAALQAAQKDENNDDVFGAVKEYQKVLNSYPKQVQALAGEGWLLAQTGQPGLLKQGLTLLQTAEQVQPTYPPAHVYRGIALLGEGDYTDSIPELQWYLDHSPEPQLVAEVRSALAQAKAKAPAAGSAAPGGQAPASK